MNYNVNTLLILALMSVSLFQTESIKRDTSIKIESLEHKVDSLSMQVDSLNLMHPWKDSKKKRTSCLGTHIGKHIFGGYRMSESLFTAMQSYEGPQVRINSCFRNWNRKSLHFHGKAIDIQVNDEILEWLVSGDGRDWMEAHRISFMIEDKPKAQSLLKYKRDPKFASYVFENPHATGHHIHLQTEA